MVKLASAREVRIYGPRMARNRSEYINAGLYVFATIMLIGGFAAQFSIEPKSGLVLLLIGFLIIAIVNLHDLFAHLAGIEYRLPLMWYDLQFALVEFAVPLVYVIGTLLLFLGTLFLFIQAYRGSGYFQLERAALSMLIAGPALWLLGSIHNSCQIYERAGGHVQILQESVLVPFSMASLLFLVASILNSREQSGYYDRHGLELIGDTWIWLCMVGSLILFFGALSNVLKVFKMQQMEGLRLEKLRGGAQELLIQVMEGRRTPLLVEEQRRQTAEETRSRALIVQTPYKDVLVGGGQTGAS